MRYFELLRNWQFDPNITMEVAGHLAESGWIKIEKLAQRYQAAFPTILSATYSPNDCLFRSTDFQRTRVSLHSFADGLFGVNGNEQVQFEDIPEQDIFMRPYQHCPLYSQINAVRVEQDAFVQGPEYQEMVVQRSGFSRSTMQIGRNLEFDQTSPFCTAFSIANAQVVEYSEDVDLFYRVGYGRPEFLRLYENLMCFQMQDLLRFIQSDANDHRARIFSGHVNLILILLNFEVFDGDVPRILRTIADGG
ncbi:hypothetical protein HA402_006041 [Bradysia odoriphaga]|nr:hypothetical protein HA402_006041 [Bradysia odoriphaga]